jgi:hypothetical protein
MLEAGELLFKGKTFAGLYDTLEEKLTTLPVAPARGNLMRLQGPAMVVRAIHHRQNSAKIILRVMTSAPPRRSCV